MPTPQLPKVIVDMIADIFTVGVEHGKMIDIQTLLNFMSSMYPNVAQIIAARADILLRVGNYKEARLLLEDADLRIPQSPILKAMLAFCLLAQNDPLWESYARETMELPEDQAARTIVKALAATRGVTIEASEGGLNSSYAHAGLPPMGMAC